MVGGARGPRGRGCGGGVAGGGAWGRGVGAGRGARGRGPTGAGAGTATPPPTGTQNHSGQSVFSVVPVQGVLDPGVAQDFTVTFSPDHESLYFSDRLQVVLFEKVRLRDTSVGPSSRPPV